MRLFSLLAHSGISKKKSVHTQGPGERFPNITFGWWYLFYSTQRLLFQALLIHRTKSFTDKKILNGIFGIIFTVAQRTELTIVWCIFTELYEIV